MGKKALGFVLGFFAILVGVSAFGAEQVSAVAGISYPKALGLIAAGLTIAIAAGAGAFSQGRTASAAMEGLARNPGVQGPMFTQLIVSLALIESLVIYALIIAFFIMGRVG